MPKPMRHYVVNYQVNGQTGSIDVISYHAITAMMIAQENCKLPVFTKWKVMPGIREVQHA